MVDLQAAGGTGYTLQELTEAVEAHKPAVLFLVQVPMLPALPHPPLRFGQTSLTTAPVCE